MARVPKTAAPLCVFPKWSYRVKEVNSSVRSACEPFSGKKCDTSNMDVCFDLPYKRQQVYQSDVEKILEVAEADH